MAGITDLGFNTVRFFLDMCMECTFDPTGIKEEYLDNLADLMTHFESHGLVVLPTSNDVPDPGFSDRLPCCEPFGGYRNSLYLSPDGHEMAVEYWSALIGGLRERGAPTHPTCVRSRCSRWRPSTYTSGWTPPMPPRSGGSAVRYHALVAVLA